MQLELPMFQKINLTKAKDVVVEQIEDLIVTGTLQPNQRLPSERNLAEMMKISRPTLREALTELEASGLLVADEAGGKKVANLVVSDFSPALLTLLATKESALRDYYSFRMELDSVIARQAAQNATDVDHARIRDALSELERLERHRSNLEQETAADTHFHMVLVEATHNVMTIQVMRSVYKLLENGIFVSRSIYLDSDKKSKVLSQHQSIAQSILAGDSDAAEQAARAHMSYVLDEVNNGLVERHRSNIAARRTQQFK
ncbi:MAG: FadR family transcriptional regulator [Gammaproteobacteria bacterium]|nr:FadR family transcriptional regulator [Gammaproteobacteria bacterium]